MPYTEDYIKRINRQRKLFLLINVVAALAVGIGAYLIWHQNNEIRGQAAQIQAQRYWSVLRLCEDQNRRNEHTIGQLKAIAKKIERHASAKKRAQINQSIGYNVILIDALAPVESCRKVALAAITKPPVTPPLLHHVPKKN